MINQGLKDYTRQISQSIGEVASVYVNLNQEAANMDIVIPGFATQGPNPIEISLIYNYQDRDKDEGFFGKGCHLNFYKSFENGKDYIIIKEADGSKIEYNYNASLNAFKSLESKLIVYRTIIEDEENGNWYQYEIQDIDGNKIFYNEGYCYPTLIEYKTGEKIVFEGMVMNNGHGVVVYCEFQGSRVKTILYKQDNVLLYCVDIGYDTSQRINSVKHYIVKDGNEKNLIKELGISYTSNTITIRDIIAQYYNVYTFTSNRVTKIQMYYSNATTEECIHYINIKYEQCRTKVTNELEDWVIYGFDNNQLPIYEVNSFGNEMCYSYNSKTKLLTFESNVMNSYETAGLYYESVLNNMIVSNTIHYEECDELDDLDMYKIMVNDIHYISGKGTIKKRIDLKGNINDNVTLFLWGKVEGEELEVMLDVEDTGYELYFFEPDYNNFRLAVLNIKAEYPFNYIEIIITSYEETNGIIGGLQILNRDFGTFYTYDNNQNLTRIKTSTQVVAYSYNENSQLIGSTVDGKISYEIEYNERSQVSSRRTDYGTVWETGYDDYTPNANKEELYNIERSKFLITRKAYDASGRNVISTTDELNYVTKYNHDTYGRLTKIINALNETIEYTYDFYSNIIEILNGSEKCSYTYNNRKNITKATYNGNTYEFDYDKYSNLTRVTLNSIVLVSFEYDPKTGNIIKQVYGTSGDRFEFSYNSQQSITQIKVNGALKYKYEYEMSGKLTKVYQGNSVLRRYNYNGNGQVIEETLNNGVLEYKYNEAGNIIGKRKQVEYYSLYEGYNINTNPTPEQVIRFLEGGTKFIGGMYNSTTSLRNRTTEIKAYEYDTGYQTRGKFGKEGIITYLQNSKLYPISYDLSTLNINNKCGVAFLFHPIRGATYGYYLFSMESKDKNSYIGIYIDASTGQVYLEMKDTESSKPIVIRRTYIIDDFDKWYFFAINASYQPNTNKIEYEIYLDDKKVTGNIDGRIDFDGKYHIGYKYYNSEGNGFLECPITGIMVGELYDTKIQSYRNLFNRYLILTNLLGENTTLVETTLYNLSNASKNFTIIPLENSYIGLNGMAPLEQPLKNKFYYNKKIEGFAYLADGEDLKYETKINNIGTIVFETAILENKDTKQCLIEGKDSSNKGMGLYRGSDSYLYLEYNGQATKTPFTMDNGNWHSVGISFIEGYDGDSDAGYYKTFVVYLDGNTYQKTYPSTTKTSNLTFLIGNMFKEDYPLYGLIRMLAINAEYFNVGTIYNLISEFKNTSKIKGYDELGLMQNQKIREKGVDVISHAYTYTTQTNNFYRISKLVSKEAINYKSSITRSYKYDALNRITDITDTTFGSHKYVYNSAGYLNKEDSTTYTYDKNGNILTAGSKNYNYDSLGRLISVDGKTITYGGTNPLNPTRWNNVSLSYEGRRLTMYGYIGGYYTFEYNDLGLRTAKKDYRGIGSKYYYDGDMLITEINPDYRLDFLYDESGMLYGFIYNKETKYFYIRDVLQNILGIIDSEGNLVVKYAYTAYGTITSVSGTLASTIGQYNPFKWKGYYYDKETSMYYCKNRYYVPEWCRWLTADSISYLDPSSIVGLNLFSYCGNDPINSVDPTGDFAISIGLLMAIGFGVGAVIGAGASVVGQYISNGCSWNDFSWGQLALDTLLGGVSGLLSMSPLGLGAMVAANAGLGFVGAVGGHLINGSDFSEVSTWIDIVLSTGLGALVGLVGGPGATNAGYLNGAKQTAGFIRASGLYDNVLTKAVTGGYRTAGIASNALRLSGANLVKQWNKMVVSQASKALIRALAYGGTTLLLGTTGKGLLYNWYNSYF